MLVGGATIASLVEAQTYTTTTVTSSADAASLQQQINGLHNRVSTLETQMREVQKVPRPTVVVPAQPAFPNTGTAPTPAPTTTRYPVITPVTSNNTVVTTPRIVIDQNGGTFVQGWDIYFTGRGFTPYEQILITRDGTVVGHAVVDGGGSFSSPGVFLPPGTSTFVFTGQSSSVSTVASVR